MLQRKINKKIILLGSFCLVLISVFSILALQFDFLKSNFLTNFQTASAAGGFGTFEYAGCDRISGWAKDGTTNNSVTVVFYKGGPAGSGSPQIKVGETIANTFRQDLQNAFGGTGEYAFFYDTPNELKTAQTEYVYVYIDYKDGTPLIPLLNLSGNTDPLPVTCSNATNGHIPPVR